MGDREVILSSSLILPQAEKHFGPFFVECFVSLSHCSQMSQQWKTCEAGGLGVAKHPSQVQQRTSDCLNFFREPILM